MHVNHIYNSTFDLPPNSVRRWPSGWERVGGDARTQWGRVREDGKNGRFFLKIHNYTEHLYCGIREAPPVLIAVNPGELWCAQTDVGAERPGEFRMIVNFIGADGECINKQVRDFSVNLNSELYSMEYCIPCGAHYALLEIGVTGPQALQISSICKGRKMKEPANTADTERTYLAVDSSDNTYPEIQLGRKLAQLSKNSINKITFTAVRYQVVFYQLSFNGTGPLTVELLTESPILAISLPACEMQLTLLPVHVVPDRHPLVIKIANHSGQSQSYVFTLKGVIVKNQGESGNIL